MSVNERQRTLYLLRHGKSDWGANFDDDHGRPLAERGIKAARKVGEFLSRVDQVPDLVISSSALRARTTAELAVEAGGWSSELEITPHLYGTSPLAVLDILKDLDRTFVHSVMLVGHEPTWSEVLSLLIGGGEHRFPTAALACLRFEATHWSEIRAGSAELQWLLPPRLLGKVR